MREVRRKREEKRRKTRGEECRAHTASSWLVLVDLIFLLRRSTWSLKCCMFFWSSSCCCNTSFRRLSVFLPSFCCSEARLVSLSRSTSNSRTCDQQQNINNLTSAQRDSSKRGENEMQLPNGPVNFSFQLPLCSKIHVLGVKVMLYFTHGSPNFHF